MKDIEFYFDFLSPYSYLAWNWVKQNIDKYNFSFYPVPLAGLIRSYETKGPAEIVPKRNYLFKHCLRYAELNKISFHPPEKLPFNPLYALRMALEENAGSDQFQVIDTIFMNGWAKGHDIGDENFLVKILLQEGIDGNRLLDNVGTKEIRNALKLNLKRALDKNIFGVPTFIIDNELFWGNDSIEHLKLYLDEMDPLDKDKYKIFLEKEFTIF
ncbi:MAG: hypothetical protein DRQ88_01590 [Epsilonproteobacteria bacterium]|nr:MAG: hypothetical protein DRQ89_06465 [Campylobacterota bacterium]RLA67770.1 MAG: hypothetical protein DRQ88_01590 [Campylobacterota bacterium]